MARVYVRKFDWDEARARHAAGESYSTLAREYGVSVQAVWLACNDDARARVDARRSEWQRNGTCPSCGRSASRTGSHQHLCWGCSVKARTISVAENELRCCTCQEWKPDTSFPSDRSRAHRRNRSAQCTRCQSAARRAYRQRNAERERIYAREYKRRRRAAA